ncbi:uncharacterized protein LOC125567915 [Nematostella vectensis]|uniref:uncharacterized protein LOC125567915 n=1 Tax=Nematostella vectensis TaxID=45351 RepID=UPI0020776A41|nr:uncharacterized protein LOC125567915 [Nematostella vectensis]
MDLDARYTFITNPPKQSSLLVAVLDDLGLNLKTSKIDCTTMTATEKLGFLHGQFQTFLGPLTVAYQYEKSYSKEIAYRLTITKRYTSYAVKSFKRDYPSGSKIPNGVTITEAEMDKKMMKVLSDTQASTGVQPTVDNIKIYRNFVIVNTLIRVMDDTTGCIPNK